VARKSLVTGGAGFIGSHLTEALVRRGDDVTVVDNLSTGLLDNLATVRDDIRFIQGDLSNPDVARKAVADCEVVFHQAAIPSVQRSLEDPLACHASGTTATANVLWAAANAGVSRVVFAGSAAIYGREDGLPHTEAMVPDPQSLYAATKVAGEYYLKSFSAGKGLDSVSLRYFNVFGPRQDPSSPYSGVIAIFTEKMARGERPTIYGDGEQTRDFIYVEDAVQANLLAAEAEGPFQGEVFNVGSGRRVSINQLAEEIGSILGTNLEPVYAAAREGEVWHSQADITKIRRILGYQPRVSLREGLTKLLKAQRG
jgi:UDP-glucose 4-epimerase